MKEKTRHIACGRCEHYFVSFEAARPHGCKVFGFKSSQPPSFEVFAATGMNCAQFKDKFQRRPRATPNTVRR